MGCPGCMSIRFSHSIWVFSMMCAKVNRRVFPLGRCLATGLLVAGAAGAGLSAQAEDSGLGRFALGGAAGLAAPSTLVTPASPGAQIGHPLLHIDEQSDISASLFRPLPGTIGNSEAALGMSYGTRLSPSVSLSLTPSIGLDQSNNRMATDPSLDWGSVNLSLGLSWQISPHLGLTGTAGAGRQMDGMGLSGPNELGTSIDLFTGLSLGFSF